MSSDVVEMVPKACEMSCEMNESLHSWRKMTLTNLPFRTYQTLTCNRTIEYAFVRFVPLASRGSWILLARALWVHVLD